MVTLFHSVITFTEQLILISEMNLQTNILFLHLEVILL